MIWGTPFVNVNQIDTSGEKVLVKINPVPQMMYENIAVINGDVGLGKKAF